MNKAEEIYIKHMKESGAKGMDSPETREHKGFKATIKAMEEYANQRELPTEFQSSDRKMSLSHKWNNNCAVKSNHERVHFALDEYDKWMRDYYQSSIKESKGKEKICDNCNDSGCDQCQ